MNTKVLEQAEAALKANRYQEALRYYRSALQGMPDDPIAMGGVAYCLYNLGRASEAFELAQGAVQLDPGLPIPHVVLANILDDRREIAQSRAEALRSVELGPNSAEALCCFGTLLLEDRDLDQAVQYLTRAVEVQPEMYLANYNLAVCYSQGGDVRRFRRQVMKIFRLKPTVANLVRMLVAPLATNTLLLALVIVLPAVLFVVGLRVWLWVHAILLGVYLSSGALMLREKQTAKAYRNFGMALFFAILDTLLIIGVR